MYRTVLACRELRKKQIGEFINQEFLIEKWEGVAESCKMLALKQLSLEKYEKTLRDYLDLGRGVGFKPHTSSKARSAAFI